mmetsp:Transcript_39262/g.45024  ORF Transcript_39262/g.45024 Transcript_39262/m.45024 type:complete len:117 (-) Transcript_39262:89-439(-)
MTEHMINYSFICSVDFTYRIADAIMNIWRKDLTKFEITVISQLSLFAVSEDENGDVKVPLLDALTECNLLQECKIQYMINDQNNQQSQELTQWVSTHQRFVRRLAKFVLKPIYDID